MTKGLMATMLALSVAFTSVSTTSARAQDAGEIGRFLLGAGALFAIGSAIGNRNNNNNRGTVHVQRNNHNYTTPAGHHYQAQAACARHDKYGNRYISQRCMRKYGY